MSGQRHGVFSGPGARARATRHDDDERKEQCPLTREDAAAGAAALAEHIQIVDEAFFAAESAVLAAFTHVSALASLAAAVAAAVGDLGLLALDANGEEHEAELMEFFERRNKSAQKEIPTSGGWPRRLARWESGGGGWPRRLARWESGGHRGRGLCIGSN